MKYCVRHHDFDTTFFGANKKDIVDQVFNWKIDNNRKLHCQCSGYKKEELYSYSEDFTDKEMIENAVSFLFGKLPDYHWYIFKNTNLF